MGTRANREPEDEHQGLLQEIRHLHEQISTAISESRQLFEAIRSRHSFVDEGKLLSENERLLEEILKIHKTRLRRLLARSGPEKLVSEKKLWERALNEVGPLLQRLGSEAGDPTMTRTLLLEIRAVNTSLLRALNRQFAIAHGLALAGIALAVIAVLIGFFPELISNVRNFFPMRRPIAQPVQPVQSLHPLPAASSPPVTQDSKLSVWAKMMEPLHPRIPPPECESRGGPVACTANKDPFVPAPNPAPGPDEEIGTSGGSSERKAGKPASETSPPTGVPDGAGPSAAQERGDESLIAGTSPEMLMQYPGEMLVINLPPEFQMRLDYIGRLAPPERFRNSGDIVLNFQYFHIGTGGTMGTTRQDGRTLSDDMRRRGMGVIYEKGPDWRIVEPEKVADSSNGFQCGPTLVVNGKAVDRIRAEGVNPDPWSRRIRSALCRFANGRTKIVISRTGHTLNEFSRHLAELGAAEAIGFDGGASAFLYLNGKSLIKGGRHVPSALVINLNSSRRIAERPRSNPPENLSSSRKIAERSCPEPPEDLVDIPIENPATGRLVPLVSSAQLEGLLSAEKAVIASSPPIFDPGMGSDPPGPLGLTRCNGNAQGPHRGKIAGYTFIINSHGGLEIMRCTGRHFDHGLIGSCGPLYCRDGNILDLAAQGYTQRGGLFEPEERVALAQSNDGKLWLLYCREKVTPGDFAERARAKYRVVVGLSGGKHSLLYVNGEYIIRPGAFLPFVMLFSSRQVN